MIIFNYFNLQGSTDKMSTIIRVGPGGTADFIQDSASLRRISVTSSVEDSKGGSLKDEQHEGHQSTVSGTYRSLFLQNKSFSRPN